MQSAPRKRRKSTINIISLVDIVFLLLIFFVVTAKFMDQPSIIIDLPPGGAGGKKKKASTEIGEPTPMTVTISRDAEIFLGDQPIRMDELEKLFKERVNKRGIKRLLIKADSATALGVVTKTMQIARDAKIDSVQVLTKKPKRQTSP